MLALAPRAQAQEPSPAPVESPAATPASGEPAAFWGGSGCAAILVQVRDVASGTPLPGAVVWAVARRETPEVAPLARGGSVRSAGLTPPDLPLTRLGKTSPEGTLVVPSPGAERLQVKMPGYEPVEALTPCTEAITVLEVSLHPLPPEKTELAGAGGDAHRVFPGQVLESMAGTPRNVFQAVETLPDVSRPGFGAGLLGSILGSGDLAVRGSRPGESKTYLDGIEIPYFYHYLALSSVVPAEMIDLVDFIPGGAGAPFGRLTGGVLDIHSRALRAEDSDAPWHGRANMDLWEGNAIARGPVGQSGQLSVSDRFSLENLLLGEAQGLPKDFPIWGYDDFQAVYKQALSPGATLDVLGFGSVDDLSLVESPTLLHTEFYRAGIDYKRQLESARYSLAASYGYDRDLIRLSEPGQGIRLSTERRDQDLRLQADGEMPLHEGVTGRAGLELHGFSPMASMSLDWEQQEWAIIDRAYRDIGVWSAAWTEAEVRPLEQVVIVPGLRWDYDTLVNRGWMDPRLTVRYFLDPATEISGAAGDYHRPDPYALAFLADRNLGISEAIQTSLGVEHRFRPEIDLDLRLYRNVFHDQVQGIEWIPNVSGTGEAIGDGQSIGAELYGHLALPDGRTRAEVGVAYSRTTWNNVQTNGLWTPSDLDNTWALILVLNHEMRRNWSFGLRARYYTGFPYTTYTADVFVPDNGAYVGVGENPFAGRAPDFFQTDIRLVKRWNPSPRMGVEAFLDVQNVTGQPNADTASAGGSGGKPTLPAISGAMPFFPSLGLSLTF